MAPKWSRSPADAGCPLRGSGRLRLSTHPCNEGISRRTVTSRQRRPIATKGLGERLRAAAGLQPRAAGEGSRLQPSGCSGPRVQNWVGFQDVVLDREEPRVEYGAEGARRDRRRAHRLGHPSIDRFEPVQRRLRFRDMDLGRGEPSSYRALREMASEERLARTVFAAHRFEHRPTAGDRVELGGDRGVEALEADREKIESDSGTVPRRRASITSRRRRTETSDALIGSRTALSRARCPR